MWDIAMHQVLGAAEMIAPFLGAGAGAYRRDWGQGRRTYAALFGLTGFDLTPQRALSLRIALSHHEVFSQDMKAIYGSRFQITSLILGLSYAMPFGSRHEQPRVREEASPRADAGEGPWPDRW
jgi:hypothetical protein